MRIEGRVQAVWFRAWTTKEARKRGLRGWVRNRADGSVEALFAGDPESVDGMIDACRRGSPASRVRSVQRFAAGPDELDTDQFVQRPTL